MKPINLLFLQNAVEKYPVSRVDRLFKKHGFIVDYRWAYDQDLPRSLDGYDCLYLSESPYGVHDDADFIRREHELIREAAVRKMPVLGVCFGAQILASALFGSQVVFKRPECEVGYVWLDISREAAADPVFKDLGERIRMFVWHNDEVRAEQEGMTVYAGSADCPNHMWKAAGLPCWGVQGHPEVTREIAPEWFGQNSAKLKIDGANVEELIQRPVDNSPAPSIFTNFMNFCHAELHGQSAGIA